jgi:hypothetical protein
VGNDFAGDIAELIAYNTALSEGVRHKVEGYLAHKWGLAGSLPSTHTYKVGKPAFGGAQVLTFQPLSDKQAGQTIALNVSSDSGLSTFSYDSNDSSVVSFSGNVATALKVGKVTITATQAGQSPWLSATATQPFIVTATPRVDQTITFVDIPNKTVQSSNFDLNATASSGFRSALRWSPEPVPPWNRTARSPLRSRSHHDPCLAGWKWKLQPGTHCGKDPDCEQGNPDHHL